MADQKTEDTKSPLPRRGARPFAGPAATSAARPFLRPVTTPQRATAAPFVPPIVPGKPALGSVVPARKSPTPVRTTAVPAAAAQAASPLPRPVTSEMIAVDAFDAFDTVWGADHHQAGTTEPQPPASPLDESSLGSGIDAQGLWADDITAAGGAAAGELEPAAAPGAAVESTYTTPTSAIPAWLEDDPPVATPAPAEELEPTPEPASEPPDVPPAAPAWPTSEYDPAYAITEWTPAHGVPTADDELVSEQQAESEPVGATGAPPSHHARIATAFDRLADRIRSGEIDVSSIAPDAPDAAVLASVLAALLGGSSSR
jgi:hypothetical protein